MMDHYEVLGLNRNANKIEIRKAFKKLALKYHPDKHFNSSQEVRDDATRNFKQLSEAYTALMDDRKREDHRLRSASSRVPCAGVRVSLATNDCANGRYAFNVNPPKYTKNSHSEPSKNPEKTDQKTPNCKACGTFKGVEVTSRDVMYFGGFVFAGAFAVGSAIYELANKLTS
ncbi:hypothetical protein C5167_006988 [Papaver somniferum]|uniref:J domain-containing protein n=1 Tax=Papaver somniferum TaxID=3469 RepID=A0A4Y7JFV4_PAPSO|nr:uncharacterized protein LOC113274364 [Papaver somniferum]RZC59687.1 hypothetical protein C5167_006988 [Papaver somniferum]